MKKPEPLKDKIGYVDGWQIRDEKDVHPSHKTLVFEGRDIYLAIEWLKKELSNYKKCPDLNDCDILIPLFKKIDEAFEDVVKK